MFKAFACGQFSRTIFLISVTKEIVGDTIQISNYPKKQFRFCEHFPLVNSLYLSLQLRELL